MCVFAGRKGDLAEASLPCPPAEGDGAVSDPPSASQTGAAGHSHDRLHGPGGFIPQQQPLPT